MTWTNRRRVLVPMLIALMIAAACGSSDAEPDEIGVASLGEETPSETSDPTDAADGGGAEVSDADAPDDPELAFARFDECMADAGFDVGSFASGTDDAGEGVVVQEVEVAEGDDPQGVGDIDFGEEFQAAQQECEKHLANLDISFDLSPEEEAAMEDAQLAWSDCMRAQGVDVPEFDAGSGGAIVIGGTEEGSDPQSGGFGDADFDFEAFEEANRACEGVFEEILGAAGIELGAPEGP